MLGAKIALWASEVAQHIFYHLLGSFFEQQIEAYFKQKRRQRKRHRTNTLAPQPLQEDDLVCVRANPATLPIATSRPIMGMCIIDDGIRPRVARIFVIWDP